MKEVESPLKFATQFPSPCGEKVGINIESIRFVRSRLVTVSVPLRGKGRDQQKIRALYTDRGIKVSVPLRGKGRDQHRDGWVVLEETHEKFPSPCGEKVGINYPSVP